MEHALSSFPIYNLLVNLIPGTVLAFSLKFCVGIDLFTLCENSWLLPVLLYFLGVLNSRISSLIFEPIIRKTKFVKVMPYENFIAAELKDSSGKLTVLSRMNNEYRSYLSLFFIVLIFKLILYPAHLKEQEFPFRGTTLICSEYRCRPVLKISSTFQEIRFKNQGFMTTVSLLNLIH